MAPVGDAPAGAPPPAEGRFGSLDGIRALGIALVLLTHVSGTAGLGVDFGVLTEGLGPSTLFVISGFLITIVLQREHAKTGRLSIPAFYLRRAIRTLPVLWVFVAAVLLLQAGGMLSLRPGDVAATLTQTMNFHADRAWWLGHLWSISLQEQFYLVWPLALAAAGFGRGLGVAVAAMIGAPLLRVAVFQFWPSARPLIDQAFPLVLDGIATGCALALGRDRLWERAWYRRFISSRWFLLFVFVAFAQHVVVHRVAWKLLIGGPMVNVAIALCVERTIHFRDGAFGALLRSRAAVWLSTVSYSAYVWQQLFLCRDHAAWFTRFPVNIVLALGAAAISYHLIERPMLRLKPREWFARPVIAVPPQAVAVAEVAEVDGGAMPGRTG